MLGVVVFNGDEIGGGVGVDLEFGLDRIVADIQALPSGIVGVECVECGDGAAIEVGGVGVSNGERLELGGCSGPVVIELYNGVKRNNDGKARAILEEKLDFERV